MADKSTSTNHPYTSSTTAVSQIIGQLRKSFPAQVNADTLKKLSIAPNNESYIIFLIRFLKITDAEGNRDANAAKIFSQHADTDFHNAFSKMISEAYKDLFELHGEAAWSLSLDKLISFFRGTDHTSEIVGKRQASTFQTLAALCGKSEMSVAKLPASKTKNADVKLVKKPSAKSGPKPSTKKNTPNIDIDGGNKGGGAGFGDMALTVRIEINLPASGDKETYDNIFKSIRENLLNAKVS